MTLTQGPWLDAGVQAVSAQFMAAANRLPTLYDLESAALDLLAALDSNPETNDEQTAAQLALVDEMMVQKVESYVSVIRSLESMAAARKAEADRLQARAQTAQERAEWLKARLLTHMKVTERERIETSRFTLSVVQNPPSVKLLDAALVPSEFQRTKIDISVDRAAILKHVRATGEVVPGTELHRTERLNIA